MTTRVSLALATALLAGLAISSSAAAAPCGKREDVVKFLDSNYKERREAMGMAGNNQLVEVYVSETGSWTIVMSMPGGNSCIIGAGEAWQQLPKAAGPNV
jgi:hypothetical protein